MFSWIIWTLS